MLFQILLIYEISRIMTTVFLSFNVAGVV